MRIALSAALLAATASTAVQAQLADTTASSDPRDVKLEDALVALTDPESPAFQLLGVAPNDVQRPDSPKKVALGILNSLDQSGNFQSGFAIEASPYLLFAGRRLTLDQYLADGWRRQLSYLQVSIGVAKGATDKDKSAKASIGLVWTPINGQDPFGSRKLNSCFRDAFGTPPPLVPPNPDGSPPSDADKLKAQKIATGKAIDSCWKANPLLPDNTTSLQFGFAPLLISETGKTDDFKVRGYAASALLTLGLSKPASLAPDSKANRQQLILAANYRHRETIADPVVKDAFLQRNRWTAGARYVTGRPSAYFLSLEGVFQRASYRDGRHDRYATIVGGVDIRVAEGFWLGLSAGTSSGRSVGSDDTFIGTRFRWGFGQKSALASRFQTPD